MPVKYDQETRAKAIRLVRGHAGDYSSEYAAITAVARRLGMTAETLRKWIRQAEIDEGQAPGVSSEAAREIRELKRKNRELEQTIEILKAATSFFAREHDPVGAENLCHPYLSRDSLFPDSSRGNSCGAGFGSGTISSCDLPPALHDLRSAVRLAGPTAAVRQCQEQRDPGAAPPDRRPATPGQITPAVVGRSGDHGGPHSAAAHRAPPPPGLDRHPAHVPALARRPGPPPLELSAAGTRTAAHWTGDPATCAGDGPTPGQASRANAICERWIASARRECTDRILIAGRRHLHHVLSEYVDHYNTHRPHPTLSQRPPNGKTHAAVADDNVRVLRRDRLGGLLHEYSQVA